MSNAISEASIKLIRRLILNITDCEENAPGFEKNEKRVISIIEKSDSMCFKSREEMNKIMESLSDKFLVHGFKVQANYLFSLYQKFMDDVSTFYDASNKINIIRFIIAMAESPTNNFYKFNQNFQKTEEVAEINWPKYLQEGLPNWSPPPEESDSDWSDSDITSDIALEDEVDDEYCILPQIDKIEQTKEPCEIYFESKQKLEENVQNKWFHSNKVRHKPASNEREANIAYLWDDYINEITGGLLSDISPSVISEYKVMREVIWQLYEPTNSFCFEFSGDKLVVKKGITISSVREYCFETVLSKILPHIEVIQSLKKFEHMVHNFNLHNPKDPSSPPDTYRCYASALKTILEPLFQQLKEVEEDIFAQESICTLITLFQRLKPIFETFELVKRIHDDVIIDFENNSRYHCATNLIIKLHEKLSNTSNNREQVIVATLFLESLRKYLDFVESWMFKDSFLDYTEEFVILEGENSNQEIVDLRIRDLDQSEYNNSIINFFCTEVFQIGRNVRLLRLLGKSHLGDILPTAKVVGDSLHDEYLNAVLREISNYFESSDEFVLTNEIEKLETNDKNDLISPIQTDQISLDGCNELDNLVDTSDGFLMEAFKQYFSNSEEKISIPQRENSYQRLDKVLKGFCPLQRIIETALFNIITDKFSQTGILAKGLFVTDHKLDINFKFLKQLFLFDGELIFPFYRRYIEQANSNSYINQIWLTTYLQDILMDVYPEFTDDCRVELKNNWKLVNDPLRMCTFIKIHTKVKWPINLLVHEYHLDMYHNIFLFILKIKWALYTLNHLYFVDLEPHPKTAEKPNRLVQKIIGKLKILRFALVNNFSSIQHYILGHIYIKCNRSFEEKFESAYDFDSIYHAHDTFITDFHDECIGFRDYQANNHGFYLLLYLVRKISAMWKNPSNVNILELDKYSNLQKQCHKVLDPIILNGHLQQV
ncbi:gamma-tubulin complex component 5-like isoform X2 [Agrilus planipennis]|uniref:Gamma-tubulin complex component n=1 Tax=Agrilus planipennis TaxID=224129 RepID=A0A7F5RFJ1_AGRPL|nr:gamma-tubulin complex component 5-like isoform X2 [Agrilus planipennis]